MTDTTILVDPTSETAATLRQRVAGPPDLEGRTVGLFDISKPNGDKVFDRLETLLSGKGVVVSRHSKPTYTKRAPDDVLAEVSESCDVVVEGLAD